VWSLLLALLVFLTANGISAGAPFCCELFLLDLLLHSYRYPFECHVVILQVTWESSLLIDLLMKIVQYCVVTSNSPFHFKGAAIQKIVDLVKIVFRMSSDRTVHIDQLKHCFKVSCVGGIYLYVSWNMCYEQ
jgi:hypothetical protein